METNDTTTQKAYYLHGGSNWSNDRFTVAAIPMGGKTVKLGLAVCSDRDNFSKKKGREIALDRAVNKPFCTMEVPFAKGLQDASVKAMVMVGNTVSDDTYRIKRLLGDYKAATAEVPELSAPTQPPAPEPQPTQEG